MFTVSLGLSHSKNNHSKSNHSGSMSKKKKDWKTEKERLLRLDREERRKEYRRQDFISLDKIPAWREETRPNDKEEVKELTDGGGPRNKVSLYKGDIPSWRPGFAAHSQPLESLARRVYPSLCRLTPCAITSLSDAAMPPAI
ncbi:hypothetical protein F7725_024226 [Dissostichus mawsoni]|uniref:Uncharacterized protein n=1 Tax=Dissostichus mawsoni TaxID=36200 RepID=A0A7J5XYR0_DISMA|nr:hypothetical protein F7725_024226 [Dissostichus mawsoni]